MFIFISALAGVSWLSAFLLRSRPAAESADTRPRPVELTRLFIVCDRSSASDVRNRLFRLADGKSLRLRRLAVRPDARDQSVALLVDIRVDDESHLDRLVAELIRCRGVATVQSTPGVRGRETNRRPMRSAMMAATSPTH